MHRRITIAAWMLLASVGMASAAPGDLPDPRFTPGMLHPDVNPGNIDQTICLHRSGYPSWSKANRPAPVYTNGLKRKQLSAMGGNLDPADFEEDHLVPLSLGGHPRDPRNLWPEHWDGEWGARRKDRLELRLYRLVCAHQVPLQEAQANMARNWIAAWPKYCPTEAACPPFKEE